MYSRRCWVDNKLQPATISIKDGIISSILFDKSTDAKNYGDTIIMPGVIDVHVHINEPGRTEWEGFDTATKAAVAGGTTTVVDMPLNSSPVTVTLEDFNKKLKASNGKLNCNVGFYAGLIPGNSQNLEAMIKAGVLGVKCFLLHSGIDEFPNVTREDLEKAMPILAKYNIALLAHCELIKEEHQTSFADNPTSYQHYLSSRPKKWENDAIDMMIELSEKYDCPVHIVHVSSAEALSSIEKAKQKGLKVTAETCAQYILFNAEAIPDAQCIYKCAPPIREKTNNDLLKQALKSGVLDFITTDHSPAPPSVKELESGNLLKAWGGIAGIQFLLSASWTAMKETMSIEKFIPLVTSHPAEFIKANKKGAIQPGADADLVCWNPDEQFLITEESVLFRHKISPYIGRLLYGVVKETIVNGETVFANNQIQQLNKGKWLLAQ
ncbi:MAG: allantoinase AllB [Sphingobacteriales bacterium]|nr:allantoinase AllB [Sphingobacteriales bacterium]MBI3718289.1 allantoinase AllB [Sphingobacteriales bacterium]